MAKLALAYPLKMSYLKVLSAECMSPSPLSAEFLSVLVSWTGKINRKVGPVQYSVTFRRDNVPVPRPSTFHVLHAVSQAHDPWPRAMPGWCSSCALPRKSQVHVLGICTPCFSSGPPIHFSYARFNPLGNRVASHWRL